MQHRYSDAQLVLVCFLKIASKTVGLESVCLRDVSVPANTPPCKIHGQLE